jgi:hypothetical protein
MSINEIIKKQEQLTKHLGLDEEIKVRKEQRAQIVESNHKRQEAIIEKAKKRIKMKGLTRGSIRGIKTFLGLPEDHTRGGTFYTEAKDIRDFFNTLLEEEHEAD